jgi:hypothetical protein
MGWVLYHHIQQYIAQRYHIWILGMIGAVFCISYFLGLLSPADQYLIQGDFFLAGMELLLMVLGISAAIYARNWLKSNYTHMLHARSMSYSRLYILYWIVGMLPLLYTLVWVILLWTLVSNISPIIITMTVAYLWLKILFLYTIAYVLATHMDKIIAVIVATAIYLVSYSVPMMQSVADTTSVLVLRWFMTWLVYLFPHFINNSLHNAYQVWLVDNFFSIAISQGIYILAVLLIGSMLYHRTRRK